MRPKKANLIADYRLAILTWLRDTGPKSPAEIEDFIRSRFQVRWKPRDRRINGQGIPQWRNDVHWARAHLNGQGFTVNGGGLVHAVPEAAVKPRAKKSKPTIVKEKKPEAKALFDSLTADVLAALRKGSPPWRKLWGDLRRPRQQIDFSPLAIPTNAENGKPYVGVNTLFLWNATRKRLLTESRWGTAQTWWRLAADVKPQAEPSRVLAWVMVGQTDNDDEEDRRPVWHRVFNLSEVDGCDHLRENRNPVRRIRTEGEIDTSRAWQFIQKCGAKVKWGGNEASYNLTKDLIRMLNKQRFRSELDIITVLFHELGHWTRHPRRLNRPRNPTSGPDSLDYAFEELVAELTACFLLAMLDIPDRYEVCQHAAYIRGYIKLLESDRKALYRAAGLAGKATRYLLGLFQGKK